MSVYAEINRKLKADGVILLPTETVYGLACDAANARAVNRIYGIKGRKSENPLAVCVKNLETAQRLGVFPPKAIDLAKRYWPGSLTLLVEAKEDSPLNVKCHSRIGCRATIAFRCPEADWLPELDGPLALTSANRSGEKDCVSYEAALTEFEGQIDASLSSDTDLSGLPSTIVSVFDGDVEILRQGTLKITL